MATLIDENLALREVATDSVVMLTTDGTADQPWGAAMWGLAAYWSPDSRYLLAGRRADPIEERWPLIRYPAWDDVPEKGFAPTVEMWPVWWWAKTPEAFELHLFDLKSNTHARVPIEPQPGQWVEPVEWIPDGSGVLVVRRGPQARVLDLLVVDPADASVRLLDSESVEYGTQYAPNEPPYWRFLDDGRRFIFRSERDGYQNLVLYDVRDGFLRTLTTGSHPVRSFRAHEASGWVYFAAQLDDDRPYDRHVARVPLAGGAIERLSAEHGQHSWSLSPSGKYFLDRHLASDRALRTDLKATDGRFIMTLEAGSTDRIRGELRWSPPEEFSVVAPDGVTELHGTLFKPWDFDPDRSYPVIDNLAALHGLGSVVLRDDAIGQAMQERQAMAQLGFIVVTFDARGTHWRGRDFRLSTWGRGDTDLVPEHVHVIRQLARDRPWMDIERVGVYGFSHFGYQCARAMLMAPEFFTVGVCGAAPDRQGLPGAENVGSVLGSAESPFRSNSSMAGNLEGRLLLIVGTEDFQGPLYTMMPLMDALVKADKQYAFRLIPGMGHGTSPGTPLGRYYWDAVAEHFLAHLSN
jgi:dipeptidyl aminopeptidase/acylaminoacyl peptidase